MRESIQKFAVFLLALLLIVGMIPASVMATSTPTASYCTHVQNEGWQDYVSNGLMNGTEGKSYRLEGTKIKLDTQGYDLGITYQTHIQNIGMDIVDAAWIMWNEFGVPVRVYPDSGFMHIELNTSLQGL